MANLWQSSTNYTHQCKYKRLKTRPTRTCQAYGTAARKRESNEYFFNPIHKKENSCRMLEGKKNSALSKEYDAELIID